MNAYTKAVLAAVVVLGAGCGDPFNAEQGGPPQIVSVNVSTGSFADIVQAGTPPTGYDGGASGAAWTVSGVPSACVASGVAATDQLAIFVRMNKLLNGYTVQTSPTSCLPAGGWLTVTPAPSAGNSWYSCYNPSSPRPGEGASVVIFEAPTPVTSPPATVAVPPAAGWESAAPVAASTTGPQSYHAVGRVFDKAGAGVDIDVTVQIDAPPSTCP